MNVGGNKNQAVVLTIVIATVLTTSVPLLAGAQGDDALAQAPASTKTSKPNFTGVWKMDMSQSRLPDGTPVGLARGYKELRVSLIHVEPAIAVNYDIKGTDPSGDRSQSYIVKTDGVETPVNLGGEAIAYAKWEGDSLVIYHKRPLEGDGYVSTRRTFTLLPDGKTLRSVPLITLRLNGRSEPDYGGETEVWVRQ